MRGGGTHKAKRSKAGNSQAASAKKVKQMSEERPKNDQSPAMQGYDKEFVIRMWEEDEGNRKFTQGISEGSDVEMEQTLQIYRAAGREALRWNQEQEVMMEFGIRWAVEARRKGRQQGEEQRRQQEEKQRWHDEQEQSGQQEAGQRRQEEHGQMRQGEQEQNSKQSKQGNQVRFGEEEQLRETRAKKTDEPEITGRLAEVRTGRGSAGLVRGEMRGVGRTRPAGKAKEMVMEERVNMKGEEEELEEKENSKRRERKRRRKVRNNAKKKRETRGMRWADCEDDEGKEEEEREQEKEKETRQETEQEELTTSEKPPGLEQREESEHERKEEEEMRAQEAREEERKAQ